MQRLYKQFFSIFSFFFIGGFFLLGNITLAGPLCSNIPSPYPGHIYTCEFPDKPKCSAGETQNCGPQADCQGGALCCICRPDLSQTQTSTIDTTNLKSCLSPVGATKNSITGICSCPTGQKEVNGKCESCAKENVCCGVQLNTSIPFIGNCIESSADYVNGDESGVSGEQAFPVLIGSLTKILISVILIASFVLIVVAGVMIASGNYKAGKTMIINVAIGLALLGASGVILRLINPNFFG